MKNIKHPGQVGHIMDDMVAIAAVDFVSCSRILIGEIRASTTRIVLIGGKMGSTTAIVARQDNGEDMHVPMLSAIYVNFEAAADAYLTRSEFVRQYANEAMARNEKRRSVDLNKAALRLFSKSVGLRSMACVSQ